MLVTTALWKNTEPALAVDSIVNWLGYRLRVTGVEHLETEKLCGATVYKATLKVQALEPEKLQTSLFLPLFLRGNIIVTLRTDRTESLQQLYKLVPSKKYPKYFDHVKVCKVWLWEEFDESQQSIIANKLGGHVFGAVDNYTKLPYNALHRTKKCGDLTADEYLTRLMKERLR